MNENKTVLPYTELPAGDRTYLLRLTALSAARLEERLGMSVYKAAERMDEVTVIAEFVYALIEGLKPEFSRQDAYAVIDDFISAGGTLAGLNKHIAEALKISGFFGQASGAQES
ncbi:MAG TPA: hypothetical protein DDX72_10585 [Ruminococcaceae bacterium]|nr:hypothetical protein [Oscillospiraceae bacterium]